MRRIPHILAILLVTILVVAGPCPACPAPQPEKSAHDCCPGGKTTKKAPSKDDCPLIAYYLDVTKAGKSTQDLIHMPADAPATGSVLPPAADPQFTLAAGTPDYSGNGRYSYRFLSTFLI